MQHPSDPVVDPGTSADAGLERADEQLPRVRRVEASEDVRDVVDGDE